MKVKGPLKTGVVLIGNGALGAGKFRGMVTGEQHSPGGWVWLTTPKGRKVGVAPSDFKYVEEVPEVTAPTASAKPAKAPAKVVA